MAEPCEIYIDESGTFGDWTLKPGERESSNRVIGGIVVPAELAARENELHSKLSDVQKAFFPAARHITGIHISELKDFKQQEELRGELRQIFQEHMPGAQIIFIYDRSKPQEIKDLPGAKFYRNLLFHLLQTIVFFHPKFASDTSFTLKLAHRRFSYVSKIEDSLAGQGYLKLRSATNGHTQFTAVTAAELTTSLDTIQRSLPFFNKRTATCVVKGYEQWDSPFMVMADWICNTLLWMLDSKRTDSSLLNAVEKTFGRERILFFCPSNFELPEALVAAFNQKKFDQFLALYMLREKRTYIPDRFLLYPAYQRVMETLFNEGAVSLTDEQCSNLTGIADHFLQRRVYGRLGDVQKILDIQAVKMKEIIMSSPDGERDRIAWRYHDAGLRYANHSGNIILGQHHYEAGKILFERLTDRSIEDRQQFHLFLNRAAIVSANEFAFERSNVVLENAYREEKDLTAVLCGDRNETYGKLCGTKAQNYAFQHKKNEAEIYFSEAVKHFSKRSDLVMQASFRAHLALDNREAETFRQEIATILNLDTFPGYEKCLAMCLASSNVDVFSLHLLLKGIYILHDTTLNERKLLWIQIEEGISEIRHLDFHPWQLFFTVAGRLLLLNGERENARRKWRIAANIFTKNEENITLVILSQQAMILEAVSWLEEGELQKAKDSFQPVVEFYKKTLASNRFPGICNPQGVTDSDGVTRSGWFDGVCERLVKFDQINNIGELKRLADDFLDRFTFNYW